MKKVILFCICMLACWACEKEAPPTENVPPIISVEVSEITANSAQIFLFVATGASKKAGIIFGTDSKLQSNTSEAFVDIVTLGLILLDNLQSETTYYYKAFTVDAFDNRIYDDNVRSFKTISAAEAIEFGNGIIAAERFAGGDGAINSPYIISSPRQLKKFVDDVKKNRYSNIFFRLTTDINVSINEWIPIGTDNYHPFGGSFDGNGHTISGMLNSVNYSSFGFFGATNDASILNLTITATVRNDSQSDTEVQTGGIVGRAAGSGLGYINNCHISGSIKGGGGSNQSFTGGIVGSFNGENITNCTISASAEITGGYPGASTGGIAGSIFSGSIISSCTNHANVNGGEISNVCGGLVGYNYGTIHTSMNTGNVTAATGAIGGLLGVNIDHQDNKGHVYSCCTNSGTVNGQPASANNQIGYGNPVEPCPDGHAKR